METLSDPCNDRVVKTVAAPPHRPLTAKLMYSDPSRPDVPNLQVIRKHLIDQGTIGRPELVKLIKDVTNVFKKEANVLKLKEPVVIIGDIHGQFYDMIHMFEKIVDGRKIPETKLLFLGDYVDRGIFSIEVLILLFTLKLNYPKDVVMLRGNHETRAMTEHFTFRNEVLDKFKEEQIYDMFLESFEAMPIAAIVNNDYLCVHGGISPDLVTSEDINRKIDRFKEPPLSGLLCDLLWSDPVEDAKASKVNFRPNEERECSFKFGLNPVKEFLKKNSLLSIIRAHQVQIDGYKMHKWGGSQAFPPVMTVFSAPNYCGTYSNKGAVIVLENDNKLTIKQYRNVDHPYHLPRNMDLFGFSIPYLAEQVSNMLFSLVGRGGHIEPLQAKETDEVDFKKLMLQDTGAVEDEEKKKAERIEVLRNKIKAVARMARIFKNLRTHNDLLITIKHQSLDGKIPRGLLLAGTEAIREFRIARALDRKNEKHPVALEKKASFKNLSKA